VNKKNKNQDIMNKVIEINGLHKVYTETAVPVHAVNDVSLSFEQGEFAAIVGPSGCGKTTLLNMIGGLDYPSEGNIQIDGTDIGQFSKSKLTDLRLWNIGFVFQAYNLIPVLTARENVEFIMELQKRPKKERRGVQKRCSRSCRVWAIAWMCDPPDYPVDSSSGWPWPEH
jgi:putative ABC transport system ATP-binding protein